MHALFVARLIGNAYQLIAVIAISTKKIGSIMISAFIFTHEAFHAYEFVLLLSFRALV